MVLCIFDVNKMMNYIYRPFHTHFDELIIGLLISNIQTDKEFIYPKLLKQPKILLILSVIIAISLRLLEKVLFTYTSLGIFFGAFIFYLINSKDLFITFMSHRLFYLIARLSFGVYISHTMVVWFLEVLGWFKQVFVNNEIHLLTTFTLLLVISCLISSITYIIIEHPALKYRSQILRSS